MMRLKRDEGAVSPVIVGLLVIVVALAAVGGWWWYAAAEAEDAFVPTIEMTTYSRSSGDLYRIDLGLEVDDPSFLDYFFPGSVSDPGFPSGDTKLELVVYDARINDADADVLVHETWMVGNLYDQGDPDVPGDENQQRTWEVELPQLQVDADPADGAVHLWAYVYVDRSLVDFEHWTVNPDVNEVEEA